MIIRERPALDVTKQNGNNIGNNTYCVLYIQPKEMKTMDFSNAAKRSLSSVAKSRTNKKTKTKKKQHVHVYKIPTRLESQH